MYSLPLYKCEVGRLWTTKVVTHERTNKELKLNCSEVSNILVTPSYRTNVELKL